MNNYVCALSGDSPIVDPVCTPTGQICSKRLLVLKLNDTNGCNPFVKEKECPLDETMLIDLSTTNTKVVVVPPKVNASIPSVLNQLQSEYDALVLELYDTRKALQTTRCELTESLYQNDAAIRVIARIVLERDVARQQLNSYTLDDTTTNTSNKRPRTTTNIVEETTTDNDESTVATPTPTVTPMEEDTVVPQEEPDETSKIPTNELQQLELKWKELSKARKTMKKSMRHKTTQAEYATLELVKTMKGSLKKKLHKASYKAGLLALTGSLLVDNTNNMLVTNARDKQIIFYNPTSDKIIYKDTTIKQYTSTACMDYCGEQNRNRAAAVGDNGILYLYTFFGDNETVVTTSMPILTNDNNEEETVVGVCIHPTGNHLFLVTNTGTIYFVVIQNDVETVSDSVTTKTTVLTDTDSDADKTKIDLQIAAIFSEEASTTTTTTTTCAALHPDGLILALGRADGTVALWDLKLQKLASVLENPKSEVTTVTFSENGYHIATSTNDGTVTIWDLRKQTILSTLKADDGGVYSVAFCPTGKFVAYGTSGGHVTICPVKSAAGTDAVVLKPPPQGKSPKRKSKAAADPNQVCGLLWGTNAKSIAWISTGDSSLNIYSIDETTNDSKDE